MKKSPFSNCLVSIFPWHFQKPKFGYPIGPSQINNYTRIRAAVINKSKLTLAVQYKLAPCLGEYIPPPAE